MVDEALRWVVGIALTAIGLVVALIGGVIARDRQLTTMMDEGDRRSAELIASGDQALHDRISRMQDTYVRSSDLTTHLTYMREHIAKLEVMIHDQSETTARQLNEIMKMLVDQRGSE